MLDIVARVDSCLAVGKDMGDLGKDCTDVVLGRLGSFVIVQRLAVRPELLREVINDAVHVGELQVLDVKIGAVFMIGFVFILGDGGATAVDEGIAVEEGVAVVCNRVVRLKTPVRTRQPHGTRTMLMYRLDLGSRGGAIGINVAVDYGLDRNLSLRLLLARD